jgi:hypothetical protein
MLHSRVAHLTTRAMKTHKAEAARHRSTHLQLLDLLEEGVLLGLGDALVGHAVVRRPDGSFQLLFRPELHVRVQRLDLCSGLLALLPLLTVGLNLPVLRAHRAPTNFTDGDVLPGKMQYAGSGSLMDRSQAKCESM